MKMVIFALLLISCRAFAGSEVTSSSALGSSEGRSSSDTVSAETLNSNMRNEKRFYFGPQLGVAIDLDSDIAQQAFFSYGVKAGMDFSREMNFFGLSVSYIHASQSVNLSDSSGATINADASYNLLAAQPQLRKIGGTGLYCGPQIGMLFSTVSGTAVFGTPTRTVYVDQSATQFVLGAGLGYEISIGDQFSLLPDVSYVHAFGNRYANGGNLFDLMIAGVVRF